MIYRELLVFTCSGLHFLFFTMPVRRDGSALKVLMVTDVSTSDSLSAGVSPLMDM